MWRERGSEREFEGEHVRLGHALNLPQSLSRPHPPILIAGSGETDAATRRSLRRRLQHPTLPEIPRQLDLLRRLCDEVGRDYDAIEKTAPFAFDVGEGGAKVGELLDRLRWLAGMGIEMVSGWVVGVDRITPIEIMGREVIPAAAAFAR
jgi:alkanesulfonate monooxygenase SsuD/methylene tetrahydromethanopterin reductase-like flavin-dependent oxidoreductase (luciferase family)